VVQADGTKQFGGAQLGETHGVKRNSLLVQSDMLAWLLLALEMSSRKITRP
jgi:hypothetical protein